MLDGLALEVDGYLYHGNPQAHRRSVRRRTQLFGVGWWVIAYTWMDIMEDGDAVIAEIQAAMEVHRRRMA